MLIIIPEHEIISALVFTFAVGITIAYFMRKIVLKGIELWEKSRGF